ncbi:UNVERIFIED_CONTAM: F-box only protein 42 [Gekko kuhli]
MVLMVHHPRAAGSFLAVKWDAMANSSESEDDSFMAVDPEEAAAARESSMEQEEEAGRRHDRSNAGAARRGAGVYPVLPLTLSGAQDSCPRLQAVVPTDQRGGPPVLPWLHQGSPRRQHSVGESHTIPTLAPPITQRFSHSACYYDANQSMYVFGGCTQSSCNAAFNDLWRLDLNSKEWIRPLASGAMRSGCWTWSSGRGPSQTSPAPAPTHAGGQSQIVIDEETILVLGGCGGPNALFKDAWLLHMSSEPWTWQPLRVENEDQGAPELWCHPACRVGQCVVVFSQAPSGRAPLSPSLNSRPSPISATPPTLAPETREYRSQSPVRTADEAPCVNGRWGTLRPRVHHRQTPSGSREGSLSPAQEDTSPVLNGSEGLSPGTPSGSPVQADSPGTPAAAAAAAATAEGCGPKTGTSPAPRRGSLPDQKDLRLASAGLSWEPRPPPVLPQLDGGTRNPPEQTNGIHTPPPHVANSLAGAVSPGALRRSLEVVKALSSKPPPALAVLSPPPSVASPGSPGSQSTGPVEAAPAPRPSSAQGDGHSLPPIARRLSHHPPQSLNVGKPLYQSLNCKPMQMYVLDVKDTKEKGRVQWKVLHSSSVVGPPETSLHTVVQGRGELIIFGGLMDKKQNVKYYPKTNALYFVRAKR